MKAKGVVIFPVLMILISFVPSDLSKAEEQDQKGVMSFTVGNEYLEFEEHEKWFYVRGMMDTIYAMLYDFEPKVYEKFTEATEGMTLSQFVKILDKYLEENPEILHHTVGSSIAGSLNEIVYKE